MLLLGSIQALSSSSMSRAGHTRNLFSKPAVKANEWSVP